MVLELFVFGIGFRSYILKKGIIILTRKTLPYAKNLLFANGIYKLTSLISPELMLVKEV